MYKVQSVAYDVIAADEPQIADISMIAYYYYDERFENMEEPVVEDVNNEWADTSATTEEPQDNDSQESKWKISSYIPILCRKEFYLSL